jgi:nucleoside-diphosphate-sugar epimerase
MITQIANGMTQIKLGDVSPTRDFNYVLDTCRGFIELARCDKAIGETVNIGSNYEISVGDTLNLIRELMGRNVEFITEEQRIRPTKSEVLRLWCDNTKIREMTGFKPRYDIRAGLKATIDWFVNPDNLRKYKVDIYNV